MKKITSTHVVLVAAALYIALLAFAAGGMSVTGVTEQAPHGMVEYWLERYQTLITSIVAIGGVWLVYMQVRGAANQHRAVMRFNIEPERRALDDARLFARSARLDLVAEDQVEHLIRSIEAIRIDRLDAEMRDRIAKHCEPHVIRAADRLDRAIEVFNGRMGKESEERHNRGLGVAAYRAIEARSANLEAYVVRRLQTMASLFEN